MLPVINRFNHEDLARGAWLAAQGALLALVLTPIIALAKVVLDLRDVDILYIAPVVIAATRWGLVAGLGSAIAGSTASAYLFYTPHFSLRVVLPQDVVDLVIFIGVALLTSQLAAASRNHAMVAERRSADLQRLYAFSRKLALATEPRDILTATQEHLSAQIGAHALIVSTAEAAQSQHGSSIAELPTVLHEPLGGLQAERKIVTDASTGRHWLLQRLPHQPADAVVLAVDLGRASLAELPAIERRVDATVREAISSLERLDLAKAVSEANMRREAQSLREAIVGSVSHGLRTPLAAIIGSASILAETALIKTDPRLASLANNVVAEAERLNGDIQKLLDAATVSGAGITPRVTWSEPADIVNAALDREKHDLGGHQLSVHYADEVPLVHVDPVLILQALALVIDNAARYSASGSSIRVEVIAAKGEVAISVLDEGIGLDPSERALVFQKFYRGEQVRDTTRGSGLGLWIANAFVTACRGRISLAPRPDMPGTNVTMYLPAASPVQMREIGGASEQ
jgi:two-component system sensor histidine kinase KdpD